MRLLRIGSQSSIPKRHSHNIGNSPDRQLPVVLSPVADELLSSWISRHAAFYGVPPMNMLQHCLPEATSLRAVDLQLTNKQAIRLARMFATDAKFVRGMSFANVPPISHRLIASKAYSFARSACEMCRTLRRSGEPSSLDGGSLAPPADRGFAIAASKMPPPLSATIGVPPSMARS